MDNIESLNVFIRLLNNLHNNLKQNINKLIGALASEDKQSKIQHANETLNSAKDLLRSLSPGDQPSWLKPLNAFLEEYIEKKLNYNLLKKLIQFHDVIQNHKWNFDKDKLKDAYDFDAIYNRYKEDSKLPELFDLLIDTFQKILDSDEIDSIRLTKTLEQLIATLKKNKQGSYFSLRSTWDFTISLLKNYLYEEIANIPGIGSFLKALISTVEDIENEMETVHKNMSCEMNQQYNANFPFITYTKHAKIIDNKSEKAKRIELSS